MHEITRDELKRLIDTKGRYILIDVREPDEMINGMIPTAQNVPLSEFEKAIELPSHEFLKQYGFSISKKDKVILYCRSGNRSGRAATFAQGKGYDAVNYKGSILDWSEIDTNVKKY